MHIQAKLLTLIISLFFSALLFGQEPVADSLTNLPPTQISSTNNSNPEPDETTAKIALPLSRLEFQLSLFILGFGAILILFEAYLIKTKSISSEDTIKFITVTIIIISTLFLITAGYSNDQIAPAVGLLGTIAGYLLGKINSPKHNEDEKN